MFVKFPSIESFSTVRRSALKYDYIDNIPYRGKVKLHGTNAAVRVSPSGAVVAQSRSKDLNLQDDNYGFAAWVEEYKELWAQLSNASQNQLTTVIFGEWIGPGIQSGVACSKIPNKVFAVFAIIAITKDGKDFQFKYDPDYITYTLQPLKETLGGRSLFVLPWETPGIVCETWDNEKELTYFTAKINEEVAKVEACDPWVKSVFDIEGIGEGLVYYPISQDIDCAPYDIYSRYMFKAKGEKHQVTKTKTPVTIDPEKANSIDEFVDKVLTPARLKQAVVESCHGLFEKQMIGPFLAWINKDVKKETEAELEISGLTWKEVAPAITNKAKSWYLGMESLGMTASRL